MVARVPLVTVSIPAWRCADTIHAAVSSVLGQTVDDIQLIVTIDGDDPDIRDALAGLKDDRLMVLSSERNIGRYAIDHYVAQTTRSRWMTVCDADDYVEPTWLESMLAASDDVDVVVAPHVLHDLRGRSAVYPVQEYRGEFGWLAHMGACLWSTEWLRDTGATTPHVRVGWDNIMTGMAFLCGRTRVIEDATYHRVRRIDSLTTDPRTGMRSAHRSETTRLLRAVWMDLIDQPSRSRDITTSLDYDRRLMLTTDTLPTTDWSMTPASLIELESYLYRERPRHILEMGSGLSTAVLAHYARITGARVTTLEHNRQYLMQTQHLLTGMDLHTSIDLVHAPLSDTPPMYGAVLPDSVEFLVIDGPPERLGGRAATLPHALPHLADRWTAWLDDGDRPGEQAAIRQWKTDHKIKARQTLIPRGVTLVSPKQTRRHSIDATGVVLCILTGWRPHLLDKTLSSLPPSLLKSAFVIACHDGQDDATARILDRYNRDIDLRYDKKHQHKMMHTIGDNWSELADLAIRNGAYMMMLEDDWQYITEDGQWLSRAVGALSDPDIAQVRLRHLSDRVKNRHMVTGQTFEWTPHEHGLVADTHLTFNPSIMRTADLGRVFPASGEKDAQQRAYRDGMRCVVQLVPGVFTHLAGDDDSMRARLRPPL